MIQVHYITQAFIFIGQDGSLGYTHGEKYNLNLRVTYGSPVVIDILKPTRCPYSSIDTFLENWKMPAEDVIFLKKYQKMIEDSRDGGDAHKALVGELEDMLTRAKNFEYHDKKSREYMAPKMVLANRLRKLRNELINGTYDDK